MSEALARETALEAPARTRPVLVAEEAGEDARVPAWRGVLHEKAFAFAPALTLLLVASAEGAREQAAAAIFAVTMTVMLGASTLNHRTTLDERWRPRLRQADHAGVALFLAGTWTAVALVAVPGTARVVLTAAVCGGSLAIALVAVVKTPAPPWVSAAIGLAAGWAAAGGLLYVAGSSGAEADALLALGGAFYTTGAIIYAVRRPDVHRSFGFHEVFHALVLGGLLCHYVAFAFFVLPRA